MNRSKSRRLLPFSALLLTFFHFSCEDSTRQESGNASTPIFNGQDLSGWQKQPEPGIHGAGGHWGVTEDGILFGEQDPPGSGEGGLLLTEESYGEFELDICMKPDWGPCSGIFLRTNDKGEGWQIYVDYHDTGNVGHVRLETKPYSAPFRPFSFSRITENEPALKTQADPRARDWPDGVYEESCTAEEWLASWKPSEWNQIKIRCTGETELPVIEVWVNDLKVCRFNAATTTHPTFDKEKAKTVVGPTGKIGLQVHRGNGWPEGARVFWKDIRITKL